MWEKIPEDSKVCPYCGEQLEREKRGEAGKINKNARECEKKKGKRKWVVLAGGVTIFIILIILVEIFIFGDTKELVQTDEKTEKNKIADMDFLDLIGKPEKELEKIGLKKSDEYIGYSTLNGNVSVDCTDGIIDMITITGSEKNTPSFHGVRIGMQKETAYEKLRGIYGEETEDRKDFH